MSEHKSPGFKNCLTCETIIPVNAGCTEALTCLGEGCILEERFICRCLSKHAQRASESQVNPYLMMKSVRPASDPGYPGDKALSLLLLRVFSVLHLWLHCLLSMRLFYTLCSN